MLNVKKILIVDDEPEILLLISEVIKSGAKKEYKPEITQAENGDKALALLQGDKFDIVVIDYRMPGLSGMEVITAARNEGMTLPFICMSGHLDAVDIPDDLRDVYFIPKPFDSLEFLKALRIAMT